MDGQLFLLGKANDGDVGVTKPFPVFAHGEHVLLAWQSHQVAMKDDQHRTTQMIAKTPAIAVMVEKLEAVWEIVVRRPAEAG